MKRKCCLWFFAFVVGIALAISGISSVYAQDTDDEDEFMLEEITVTAQKREENQQ